MSIMIEVPAGKLVTTTVFPFIKIFEGFVDPLFPEHSFVIVAKIVTRAGPSDMILRVRSNGDILEVPAFYKDYCLRMGFSTPRNIFNYRNEFHIAEE